MATTKDDLRRWFDAGLKEKAEFMIVVCDGFDHEDYPVYTSRSDFTEEFTKHNGTNMQRIMEVYDLSKDREQQMRERRAWNCPAENTELTV